jgi:hypothetical protein
MGALVAMRAEAADAVVSAIALTVLFSVVAHGVAARPFSRWYGARVTKVREDSPELAAVPALGARPRSSTLEA